MKTGIDRRKRNTVKAALIAGAAGMLAITAGPFADRVYAAEGTEEAYAKQREKIILLTDGSSPESEEGETAYNLGEFTTEDVQGEEYTEEIFADKELTMVNIFTTWCSPCINEIPELEKLREDMEDEGVGIIGIVLDSVDENGDVYTEAVEKAKLLAEMTGASYPFLIPDSGNMNGRLSGINAVPETFFVDKEGNVVGETYVGSRSYEEWKTIVEGELSELEEEE